MPSTILEQLTTKGFNTGRYPWPEGGDQVVTSRFLKMNWAPASGTAIPANAGAQGYGTITPSGTVSTPTISSADLFDQTRRQHFQTAVTSNAVAGFVTLRPVCWIGNAARYGGFVFYAKFGLAVNVAATRAFIGLSTKSTLMCSAEPSAESADFFGFGFNAANSNTNWRVMWKDGTTYGDADIGSNAPRDSATSIFSAFIACEPNGSGIYAYMSNQSTSTDALTETLYTTNIPRNDQFLYLHYSVGVAAAGSAVTLALARSGLYCPW